MITDFQGAVSFINSFELKSKTYSEKSLRELLFKLKNPQNNLRFIHIAGTNGKGSTSIYTASILTKAKFKVGLFTSPHIIDINERIKINSHKINNDRFLKIVQEIEPFIEQLKVKGHKFSYFDIILVVSFIYFEEEKCDIVVLETGLGGRTDPTNIIKSKEVAVITRIDLDHIELLGNSIELIAKEKAGIISKADICIVSPNQDKVVLDVLKKCAKNNKVELIISKPPKILNISNLGIEFKLYDERFKVKGDALYQIENVSTAIKIAKILNIPYKTICNGIKDIIIEGRCEVLFNNPKVMLDCAHNEGAVKELFKSLPKKKTIAIINFLKTKDYEASIEKIPKEVIVIATSGTDKNAVSSQILTQISNKSGHKSFRVPDVEKAIKKGLTLASHDGVIVIFGSFYFISDIKNIIRYKKIFNDR